VARTVIDATGVMTLPRMPDIEGLETFGGVSVHTARWDEELDLRGKRVAVVGTGASAVQVIPAIAEDVEHLTVFQRTPIWCLPKPDFRLGPAAQFGLRRMRAVRRLARVAGDLLIEAMIITVHFDGRIHASRAFETLGRAWLRHQVQDPELRDKLTPRYGFGCKRPSVHNTYLATYNRANVTLETDSIARVTPNAVVTESGSEHPVDVLVLATGFKTFDSENFPKYPVTGRGGADLKQWWWQLHRFHSYEGVAVPGFPNYFTIFGPYGYNGSSYFNLVEASAAHITRILRHARENGASCIEVTEEATERFFVEMMRRRVHQSVWQDSCAFANSYYFDKNGDVTLRANLTRTVARRATTYPLSDYRLTTLSLPGAQTGGDEVLMNAAGRSG
jgi:cyclohexanone monooxygenase